MAASRRFHASGSYGSLGPLRHLKRRSSLHQPNLPFITTVVGSHIGENVSSTIVSGEFSGSVGRVKMVAPTNGNGAHKAIDCSKTDVAIIGGGVVGVIAARRMQERGIEYKVLERQHDFGGVWHTHGNNHSTLQVRGSASIKLNAKDIESTRSSSNRQNRSLCCLTKNRGVQQDIHWNLPMLAFVPVLLIVHLSSRNCKITSRWQPSATFSMSPRSSGQSLPTSHIVCFTVRHLRHSPSSVQAPELSYRTHPNYPLGKHGPLEQITGNAVLTRLREMAVDLGIDQHTEFCSEVETVRQQGEECAINLDARLLFCDIYI